MDINLLFICDKYKYQNYYTDCEKCFFECWKYFRWIFSLIFRWRFMIRFLLVFYVRFIQVFVHIKMNITFIHYCYIGLLELILA